MIRKIMNVIMTDFFNDKLKSGRKFDPDVYLEAFPEITHYVY